MKKGLKILSALALLTITVGCGNNNNSSSTNNEKPSVTDSQTSTIEQSLNLMNNLKDAGDGIYTISGENEKTIKYTKTEASSWASVVADTTSLDLANVKGLRFTIKGQGKVLIKIESTNGGAEINLKLTSALSSYAWNLNDETATKAMSGSNVVVRVFGLPGATSGSGEFTFTKLEFITDFADSDYIINTGYTNESSEFSQYDGVSETFDVNKTWKENDANTYEVSYDNDVTTVKYSVISYQFMVSQIQGNAHKKFSYITFKAKGAAGQEFLVKTENGTGQITAKEQKFTLTGNDDIFTLDLSSYTEEQRGLINKVLFFAAPGCAEKTTGTIVLSGVYFTTAWEGQNKQEIVYPTNEYNGKDTEFDVNNYWHDNGDSCYEVTSTASPWVIKYTNAGEWSTVKTQVSGLLGNFNKIEFGVKVESGKSILVKAGGKEVTVEGTGEYDGSHFLDLSELTVEERNNIKEVLIFAEPGTANVSGSFEIHWMKFSGFTAQETSDVKYDGYGRYASVIASNFKGLDEGVYGISENTISYTKVAGQEWSCAVATLDGDFSNFTAMDYSFTIAKDHKMLLKIEGDGVNKEIALEGSENPVIGTFDLSDVNMKNAKKVVIFGDHGVAPAEGSIIINQLRFAGIKESTIADNGKLNMTDGVMFDLGDKVYDVTHNDNGSYTIKTKEGKGEWACFGLRVKANTTYTKATLTLSGNAADSLLFKAENDLGGGACEVKIEKLGDHVTVTLDLAKVNETNPDTVLFLFFANPGSTTVPTGDITIESITFSK